MFSSTMSSVIVEAPAHALSADKYWMVSKVFDCSLRSSIENFDFLSLALLIF